MFRGLESFIFTRTHESVIIVYSLFDFFQKSKTQVCIYKQFRYFVSMFFISTKRHSKTYTHYGPYLALKYRCAHLLYCYVNVNKYENNLRVEFYVKYLIRSLEGGTGIEIWVKRVERTRGKRGSSALQAAFKSVMLIKKNRLYILI